MCSATETIITNRVAQLITLEPQAIKAQPTATLEPTPTPTAPQAIKEPPPTAPQAI